ncbi:TOBE domain-containing protein [Dactylosporangium sp. CA-233914]|uniref:TOBE domain-containing protein n=1 Tax=Dactylosporangium sp. CA-233914 TaxID=3239934 RepID=UPI003D9035DE
MRLSIRNRLPGRGTDVEHGAVMTTGRVAIGGGDTVTAAITKDAAGPEPRPPPGLRR